jgi:hypothetical protein
MNNDEQILIPISLLRQLHSAFSEDGKVKHRPMLEVSARTLTEYLPEVITAHDITDDTQATIGDKVNFFVSGVEGHGEIIGYDEGQHIIKVSCLLGRGDIPLELVHTIACNSADVAPLP